MTARQVVRMMMWSLVAFTSVSFIYLESSASASGQTSDGLQTAAPKQDVKSSDEPVFKKVQQAIIDYHLTKVPLSCVKLEVTDRTKGIITVSVYEIHSDTCGGDQSVQPRLFGVRVNPKTGRMWSDANSDGGEYEPLKR